ncbi:MAG: hypothetical protein ABIP63_10050, partial [Thermoanaerobaculia bacterium]
MLIPARKTASVRGILQAFDARLKVGQSLADRALGLLESAHAAMELVVRELDHRLRVRGRAFDLFIETRGFSVELFVDLRDRLGHGPDLVPRRFHGY